MRSVVAIGAHPDDIELGCGGALLAHAAAGDSVTMLVMTGGEAGPGERRVARREGDRGTADRRAAEQIEAARLMGATLVWGGLYDCEVAADSTTVRRIEQVLQAAHADVVYVHAPEDSHQDHRAVALATLGAARRLSRVLHYQSPSTLSFTPSVFVDVTAFITGKLAALAAHASQVEMSAMVEPDALMASARHWGSQARIGYAEAFQPTRVVLDLFPTATAAPAAIAAEVAAGPPMCAPTGPAVAPLPTPAAAWSAWAVTPPAIARH